MAHLDLTPSEENTLTSHGYKILKYLGEGAYAKVYLTEYKTNDQLTILLACKIINTTKAAKTFVKKFLPRELDVMIRVSHPHIVHTHSIFQRRDKYYMCMRYAENGDLLHYITKHGTLLESQARVWIRQLALAVQYLHEMEITHRDIKCENILITSNHNVKLSDFGFARVCINSDGAQIESETYCGSLSYCAPDIIRGKPYLPKPTDLWASGVVLFVMLNKCMPFDDTNMRKMFDQQMARKFKIRSQVKSLLSPQCKIVLKKMLEPDPMLRITCSQIMESEWMNMDTRLASLTAAEEAALNKAKQDRKFSEARKTIEMSKIKSSQGSMSKANVIFFYIIITIILTITVMFYFRSA